MKIAWLMPNLHVTGGARVAIELSNSMVKRGHEVSILIPRGRRRLQIECAAKIIECGSYEKSPLWTIPFAMIGMAKELPQVDVIMACMPPYAILARWLGRGRGIPAVDYVIGHDVRFFDDKTHLKSNLVLSIYRALARYSLKRGHVLTNSHWTAVQIVAEGGVRPDGFIPHGFNPLMFNPDRSQESHQGDPVRLVTIGRIEKWKGLDDLELALNRLTSIHDKFKLLLISQDMIELPNAKFEYEVVKPVDDEELVRLYRSCDIYIHSSWEEGFGIPPLEAQACGLAIVSTDCGGVREFLIDGENALIVPPREPRTLAKAIAKLVVDVELRSILAQRGIETSAEFTWDLAAQKLESKLNTFVGGSS